MCVSVFVCAVVALAALFAVRINQNAVERRLQKTYDDLQTQMQLTQGQIDYYLSQQFIDEYALMLGYTQDGAKIFEK